MEKDQIKFEWNRQFFHIILGTIIVALILYDILDKMMLLIIILIGIVISFLARRIKIPVIHVFLQKFERKEEMNKFPGKGILFYFIGSFFALFFFPKEVALASIMVLALGDSLSHVFGINYGRIKNPLSNAKFLEGTLVGFIAGFFGALIFLPWHEALLASFAGMAFEAIEIKLLGQQIDDNMLVPLVSGAAVCLFRFLH